MQAIRRNVLRMLAITVAAVLLPVRRLAAEWNKPAFDSEDMNRSLALIGAQETQPSDQIRFKTPEIAENGAIVPIEIESRLPDTEIMYVLVEKNPQPLAASFRFAGGAEPFVATRIKMNETSRAMLVVKAGGKYYSAEREVKVTIGGCG